MTTPPSLHKQSRSNRWVSGAALILLGLIFLAVQVFDLPSAGRLFLPALGVVFLVWGIFTGNSGLLIPGGILAGLGAGIYLMQVLPLEGAGHGGVFLVSFGAGFALTALLSILFTSEKHWWALWPGGVLSSIGVMLLIGGVALDLLSFIGTYWPVVLIAVGAIILLKRK
jgi:hypothetical protein